MVSLFKSIKYLKQYKFSNIEVRVHCERDFIHPLKFFQWRVYNRKENTFTVILQKKVGYKITYNT